MATNSNMGLIGPKTLADMSVDSALVQKRWLDNELVLERVQNSILFGNNGIIQPVEVMTGQKNVIGMPKSAFLLDATPKDKKGKAARNVELIFLAALDVDPLEGNGQNLVGSEDQLELKFTSAYANDYAGGVTEETYGIDYRELELAYGVYGKIKQLLAQWLAELFDYYGHAAFNTNISPNLTSSPTSLTAGINPNTYFPGLGASSQPSYDSTAATYENNVGTAAATAGALTTSNRHTVPNIITMCRYARETKYIPYANVEGNDTYMYLMASPEFDYLRDPSNTNSWGRYWRDVGATEDMQKTFPGVRKMVIDDTVCIRDPRYSTLTMSGSASDYTATFGYLKYGRSNTRTTGTTVNDFYVNILCGPGCLLKYEPEPSHYENQPDQYNKYKGTGLFGSVGMMTPRWDLDSGDQTDSSQQQESSMLVFTSRTAA